MAFDPTKIEGLLKGFRLTKPLIAAVEGPAIAGGTEILQGTDIRVAGECAKFGVIRGKWALYPMGGSAVRLPRQIPYTVAADLLLTGRHITAPEALGPRADRSRRAGRRRAVQGARARRTRSTRTGRSPLQAILETMRETEGMHEDAFPKPDTRQRHPPVFLSDDAKEGPRAFKEKRARTSR